MVATALNSQGFTSESLAASKTSLRTCMYSVAPLRISTLLGFLLWGRNGTSAFSLAKPRLRFFIWKTNKQTNKSKVTYREANLYSYPPPQNQEEGCVGLFAHLLSGWWTKAGTCQSHHSTSSAIAGNRGRAGVNSALWVNGLEGKGVGIPAEPLLFLL